jgi:hypothetical protein
MKTALYEKTDLGKQCIESHDGDLPRRLRTMLILVDGATGLRELRKQALRLGAPDDFIEELERRGYVCATRQPAKTASAIPVPAVAGYRLGGTHVTPKDAIVRAVAAARTESKPASRPFSLRRFGGRQMPTGAPQRQAREASTTAATAPSVPRGDPAVNSETVERLSLARRLMKDSAGRLLGRQGGQFALKIDLAITRDELLGLLEEYQKQVVGAASLHQAHILANLVRGLLH